LKKRYALNGKLSTVNVIPQEEIALAEAVDAEDPDQIGNATVEIPHNTNRGIDGRRIGWL
jgi:hypothetical protein